MIYVKGNVERYVSNIVDAKKLEADGFKAVIVEPKKPEPVVTVMPEPEVEEEIVTEAPQRRQRKRG